MTSCRYVAQPVVIQKRGDGWERVHPVATFYLDENVQFIVDVAHAEQIVCHILNPFEDPTIEVHPNVVDLEE